MLFGAEKKRLQEELEKTKSEVAELQLKLNTANSEGRKLQEHVDFLIDQNRHTEIMIKDVHGLKTYELIDFIKARNKFMSRLNELDLREASAEFVSSVSAIITNSFTIKHLQPMIIEIMSEIKAYTNALAITSSKRHDIIEKYAQILVNEDPKISQDLKNILILNTQAHTRIKNNIDIIEKAISSTVYFKNNTLDQLESTFKRIKSDLESESSTMLRTIKNRNVANRSDAQFLINYTNYVYFNTLSQLASDIMRIYNGLPKDIANSINDVAAVRDLELIIISKLKSGDKSSKRVELMKTELKKEIVAYYKALRKIASDCESARAFFNKYIPDDWLKIKPFQDFKPEDTYKEKNYAEMLDCFEWYEKKSLRSDREILYSATTPMVKLMKNYSEAQLLRHKISRNIIGRYKDELRSTKDDAELHGLQSILLAEKNFLMNSKELYVDSEQIEDIHNSRPAFLVYIMLKIACRYADYNKNNFNIYDVPEDIENYVKAVIEI